MLRRVFRLHGACSPVFEDKRRQFNKVIKLALEKLASSESAASK